MDQSLNLAQGIQEQWTIGAGSSPLSSFVNIPAYGTQFPSTEGVTYPYATIKIEVGDTQWTTGVAYMVEYNVEITTFHIDDSGSDLQAVQSAIYALFPYPFRFENLPSNPWGQYPTQTRTVCIIPQKGSIKEDEERYFGNVVMSTINRFKVQLRQSRYDVGN